jgi:carbonic anhydrase
MNKDEEEKVIGELEPLGKIRSRKNSHIIETAPTDKKLILKMLLRPEDYGQEPHDYSCAGENWLVSDELRPRQSPIDIPGSTLTEYEEKFKVNFRYHDFEAPHGLVNNLKWTLKLKGTKMGGLKITDLEGCGPWYYKANHMHMHAPSEHRIDGTQHDIEFHIVHELIRGKTEEEDANKYKDSLAVLGFLFKLNKKSHPFITKMRPHDFGPIPKINFGDLLPPNKDDWKFLHYKGSLTSPPCADIVNWIVYPEVLPIS